MTGFGGRALVTGATGFIGGRLVEKLTGEHAAQVRALIRDYGRAARLARLPVSLAVGTVSDSEAIEQAVDGCDTVFHCAHDWDDPQRNLVGMENLIAACRRHSVRRLIYLSSFVVYHPLPAGTLTEGSPSFFGGLSYPDNKLTIEHLVLNEASDGGLPAVVLQPTIVYGPFGHTWTDRPAKHLLKRGTTLPGDGTGTCNAVYVDDVCDAMLLASGGDRVVGRRYLISGPDEPTWGDFYRAYADALGVDGLSFLPREEIEARNGESIAPAPARASLDLLRRRLSPSIRAKLRRVVRRAGGGTSQPGRPYLPGGLELDVLDGRCHVDISKARNEMGYRPRFDFEKGMMLTGEYLRWAYRPPLTLDGLPRGRRSGA